jgi:hypothetical protein
MYVDDFPQEIGWKFAEKWKVTPKFVLIEKSLEVS